LTAKQRAIAFGRAGHWPQDEAADSVTLDFDRRHRRRLRLATDSGAELLLDLPKAAALAAGDGLQTEAGAWIEVRAAEEPLLEITCADPHRLLRLAWHVGNRHVPAEIGPHAIRIRPDHVIAAMLRGLGAHVREIAAAFQPEGGAYAEQSGHGHSHSQGHDHGH
jgi:urease accessory protein